MSYDTMDPRDQRIADLENEVAYLRSEVARLSRTSVRRPVVPVFNVAWRTMSPPPRRELPSIREATVAPLTSPLERLIREEP